MPVTLKESPTDNEAGLRPTEFEPDQAGEQPPLMERKFSEVWQSYVDQTLWPEIEKMIQDVRVVYEPFLEKVRTKTLELEEINEAYRRIDNIHASSGRFFVELISAADQFGFLTPMLASFVCHEARKTNTQILQMFKIVKASYEENERELGDWIKFFLETGYDGLLARNHITQENFYGLLDQNEVNLIKTTTGETAGLAQKIQENGQRSEALDQVFEKTFREVLGEHQLPEEMADRIHFRMEMDLDPAKTVLPLENFVLMYVRELLRNAIYELKKRSMGGTITVGLSESAGQFQLTIHDDGPGMTPELLAKLQQGLGESTKGAEGTGTGVVAGKAIIEEFIRGKVDIQSTLGEGTTFSLNLPAPTAATLTTA